MKRGMIVSAAVLLFGLTSIATFAVSIANHKNNNTAFIAQDDVKYNEIKVEELPDAVSKAIKNGYTDYTVSKAYLGSDNTYKVSLTKNNETINVFFNADGQFLKIDQSGDETMK